MAAAFLLVLAGAAAGSHGDHVVISELATRGPSSVADPAKDEFVELYNPTSGPVDLTGWWFEVKGSGAACGGSNSTSSLNGFVIDATPPSTIRPHSFFLLARSSGGHLVGGVDGDNLTADRYWGGSSGFTDDAAIILRDGSGTIVDTVGVGTSACNETASATGGPTSASTQSYERKARASSTATTMATGGSDGLHGNGRDSGNNSADFVVRGTRRPQNSYNTTEDYPAFIPGDTVQAHDTGGTLNVRGPNPCDSSVGTKPDGANGTVAEGPVTCNLGGTDYEMWRVVWEDGLVGWSADNWLRGKVRGIDVSHWQGAINWTRVFDAGYRFAFARATENQTVTDPRFAENMVNGTNAGLAMGAYHFARPENSSDAVQEANHFLSVAGPYLTKGRLRPVLDLEKNTGGLSVADLTQWVHDWAGRVKEATGLAPIVYTSPSFASSNLNSTVARWDLWVAAWPACRCSNNSPSSTSFWSDWAFWQYSNQGTVPGISGAVDLDVFHGGLSRLLNYVNRSPSMTGAAWNLSSVSTGQPVRFDVTVASQGNVSEARMNVSYPNSSTIQRSLARAAAWNETWFSGSQGSGFQEGVRYVIRNSTEAGGPSYFYFNTTAGNFTLTNLSPLIYAGAESGSPPGNDACTQAPVPIGFPFKFFGTTYHSVHVCNDGRLQFLENTTGLWSNAAIPTAGSPEGFIAPFWADLCSGSGSGGVFNATIGAPPDRIFVVRWELARWDTGCATQSDKYNFMAVLYENSSDIQFNYADLSSSPSTGDNCASATVGIENQTGDGGIQHSFNTASCSNSTAVRFYYPNRYTYVETSTSSTGTYTAVNATARSEFGLGNTSPLTGVSFAVEPVLVNASIETITAGASGSGSLSDTFADDAINRTVNESLTSNWLASTGYELNVSYAFNATVSGTVANITLRTDAWSRENDVPVQGLTGEYYDSASTGQFTTFVARRIDPVVDMQWGDSTPGGPLLSQLGTSTFAIRWRGNLTVPSTGTVAFRIGADDNIRLFVDDMAAPLCTLRTPWPTATGLYATTTCSKSLAAGDHEIMVEYYDDTSSKRVSLEWDPAGGTAWAVIPPGNMKPSPNNLSGTIGPDNVTTLGVRGLEHQIWDSNVNCPTSGCFETFRATGLWASTGSAVDENWDSGAPYVGTSGGLGVGTDDYALRWTGQLYVGSAGNKSFQVGYNDGERLYIDGVLTSCNHWVDGASYATCLINLSQGFHDITHEFYEGAGNARATFEWDPAGGTAWQFINDSVLYPGNLSIYAWNVTSGSWEDTGADVRRGDAAGHQNVTLCTGSANCSHYLNGSNFVHILYKDDTVTDRKLDTLTLDYQQLALDVTTAPPNITSSSPASPVNDSPGALRTFSITVDQNVDVTWYRNGSVVQYDNETSSASYTAEAPKGVWNISAFASNSQGSDSREWLWNVTGPNITSFAPPTPVSDTSGATRTFNITVDETVDVTWQIDGVTVQTNSSVTAASHTNSTTDDGTHNVTASVSNANGTSQKTWTWTLTGTVPTYHDLAAYWSPVWHQDTDSSDYDADYITRVDFDGDWVGNNNWETQDDGHPLKGYIYYSVTETATHWFIVYPDFHPRDWSESCIFANCHENDMEYAWLAIRKDGTPFGSLHIMETHAHGNLYQYTNDGGVTNGCDNVDGTILLNGSHPEVFVEAKGHGVFRWDGTEPGGGDGVVYYYTGTAEEPESGNDRFVGYDLLPVDDLWIRRTNLGQGWGAGKLFDAPYTYSGARSDQGFNLSYQIGGSFDGDTHVADSAKPPFGMDGDCNANKGDGFFDTAYTIDLHLNGLGTWSNTYVYNPFVNASAGISGVNTTVDLDYVNFIWLHGPFGTNLNPVNYTNVYVNGTFAANVSNQTTAITLNNTTSASIADDGKAYTTVSNITVSTNLTLTSVDVRVNISHPDPGDLKLKLRHPDGTEDLLFSRDGGAQFGSTGLNRSFLDRSAFNGKGSSGTWQLLAGDWASGSSGTLVNWSLTLHSVTGSHNVTGLLPNTSVTLSTRTVDHGGRMNTTWVNLTRFSLAAAPASPQAAVVNSTAVNLSWGANSNPSGTEYDVYRNGSFIGSTTALFLVDTGLTPSTTYGYVVRARNGDGVPTANTSEVAATTEGAPAITSWSNTKTGDGSLTISVSLDEVVTFSATANQTGTMVWRVNNSPVQTNTSVSSSSYTASWSTTGERTVSVNASNENGTSPFTNWTVSVVNDATPPAISNLTASIDEIGGDYLRLHVAWTTDEAADGFVQVGRDPGLLATRNWSNSTRVTSHNTTLQDGPGPADDKIDDVDYGAVIYYRVRSTDLSGNANTSDVRSITAPSCSGASGGTSGFQSFGKVFNSTDGAAGVNATNKGFARAYNLNNSTSSDSRNAGSSQMGDGQFLWDVTAIAPGWGTSWRKCGQAVVLVELNNTVSLNGANYTAVTRKNLSVHNPWIFDASLLEKIPDLSATAGGGWANVTFASQRDPNGGVVNYSVYRSTDNATFTRIANVTANPNTTLFYNDTSVSGGATYYYRLKVMVQTSFAPTFAESEGSGNVTSIYVPDTTPPAGTSISYTGGYHTNTTRPVDFDNGTDGESGIGGNLVRSQTAPLTNGSCGTYGAWSTNFTDVSSPQTVTTTHGQCFRISLNVSNGDGYWTNVTGPVVRVDTTPPTGGSISYFNGINDTGNVSISFTNGSDPESAVGTNFLDIRETAYNNATDSCNSFASNWTNLTSGVSSPYTVDIASGKCYQFKMRTQNSAGLNSSDIASTDVVKAIGFTITIDSPGLGATVSHAEVPVNLTTTQDIAFIRARIVPNAWTNLTSQCEGGRTCNTSFILSGNGAYTLEVFGNSSLEPAGQTRTRNFTLSVPGTPTAAAQETARELRTGPMAISSGGQLKWRRSMNDSTVSLTHAEGGAGIVLALVEAWEALGDPEILGAVNSSSNWLVATNASRTGTTGRWWMQVESADAAVVRSDLPGGALGPVLALIRAYEVSGNGSYWAAAEQGLNWLLNNTSVRVLAGDYASGGGNLSFCLQPKPGGSSCDTASPRAIGKTGAAGAIEVLLAAHNATGNATYLNAAMNAANWLISQAVNTTADGTKQKWPRVVPPPAGGAEYFTGVREGTAGVVQALLDLYHATNNTTLLDWAVKGGNWLADRKTSDGAWLIADEGTSCSTASSPGTPCLTGYDYGAAGILDTLLRLYNATRAAYGGDANATVASFKSAARSAASWLTQIGTGKAADDVDGDSAIDGDGELRWRYEPATDRFYAGDSGETGGAASILRALAHAYQTLLGDGDRKALQEGIRRIKSPNVCQDADNDFDSSGSGSLRCRDRDSGSEFTSGRNGTGGVLAAMSGLERMIKVNITGPNGSTRNYPPSEPVTIQFNVSKLLDNASGVGGLSAGDVTLYHDGAVDTFTGFSNPSGGDYRLTVTGKSANGAHKVWVRVQSGSVKASSPEATYTVGSTHTVSASANRSQVPPGEHFNHTVRVTSRSELPLQVWLVTSYNTSGLTLVNLPANVSRTVAPGQTDTYNYTFRVDVNGEYSVTTDAGNGSTNVTASSSVNDAPSITSWSNNVTGTSAASFDIAADTDVLFDATADQTGDWTWKVDGSVVKTESGNTGSNYSHRFTSTGTFVVTANISNANGTSADRTWTVTVVGPPSVSSSSPASPVSDAFGDARTFSVSFNQTVTVNWTINGTSVQTNASVTSANYTNASAAVGTWNVTAFGSNSNGSVQNEWTWTVSAPSPQTPSIAVEEVRVNKTTSTECPSTPCAASTTDDFNLSVRIKNSGGADTPFLYAERAAHANITRMRAFNGSNNSYLAGNGSDNITLGILGPGASVWANWTLRFNQGENRSYTLSVTAKDNVSEPTDSTSICFVLCIAALTLTPSTNKSGNEVGFNGYINVTVSVKNDHEGKTVNDTNVSIDPPAGLAFVSNHTGGSANWSLIAQIGPGNSSSVNFTLRSTGYGSHTVPVRAVSGTIGPDEFTANQAVTVSGPGLSVTATPNRTSVAAGQPFNVTVTVTNNGPTGATDVTSNVVWDTSTCASGATLLGPTANRSLGDLAAGGGSNSTNYTFQLDAAGSTCSFKVYGNNTTQVNGGDTSSATTSPVSSSVLTLDSVSVNLSTVTTGQVFRLDATVTNSNPCAGCSNATLTGVWTNLTLPAGVRLHNGTNTSNVGTLAAGASNTSSFYLVANNVGTHTLTVNSTSSNGGTPEAKTAQVTAQGPNLRVAAVAPGEVARNTVFNYTLVLENIGLGKALDVNYNLTLPPGISYAGGDGLNGSVGTLNGTAVTGGSTGQNVSYTIRLSVTGAAGTYTLRGYGNGSNANGSVQTAVTAQNLASGWVLQGLPAASLNAGTPAEVTVRVWNETAGAPVSGARVNITEYNGVGLFASPATGSSTATTVSGLTDASGWANLSVVPAPGTQSGYSLRVVAAGSGNRTGESVLTVSPASTPRGSGPAFSGADYWNLFTSLPGEVAAAKKKIDYLTGTPAPAPAYGGTEATVDLDGAPVTVNVTPATVDVRVPTTVAVRATQGGAAKANLTVRIAETSGHALLAGAGARNWSAQVSNVTDARGYANLTVTPTRSAWSTWLAGKGKEPYAIGVYISNGTVEWFVTGVSIGSGSPSSAYVQNADALTSALASEISLLKNKVEWIVP